MKQSLQLKLGQHLTMTPQLQQAIRLLQLSTLELQQEIQEALDSNPLLEFVEHDGVNSAEARVSQDNSTQSQPAESGGPATEAGEAAATDAIPTELAVDTSWDDIYEPVSISGSGESEESRDFESYTAEVSTLADHLKWQLNLTPMSDTDRVIALAIIDGIDKRRISTLRLMNAAIKDKDINSRTDGHDSLLTADPGLIDLLAKMVKQRQESLGMYEQGGRPELAQQEREEMEIIQSYMPKQLSDDEAKKAVAAVIAAIGASSVKDMGKVMAELKAKYAGQMDMAKAGGIVKGLLG